MSLNLFVVEYFVTHLPAIQSYDTRGKNTGKLLKNIPDCKVHGANMGPIWGRQDPGGPHFGPMNFAIWDGKLLQNTHNHHCQYL